jgi:uncharacterized membrane protein
MSDQPIRASNASPYHSHLIRASESIRSLKAQADAQRSTADKIADWLTTRSGSMPFLIANLLWFVVWIAINTGLIPFIQPFDPFPFGLLTMIVSLEAIVLSIAVLISQKRAEQIADLRAEVDLQVDILAERELTKALYMMRMVLEKQGIDLSEDEEFQAMLEPTNVTQIEQIIERQIAGKR